MGLIPLSNFSVSRKGMVQLGKYGLSILFVFLFGYFLVSYVIPALATVVPAPQIIFNSSSGGAAGGYTLNQSIWVNVTNSTNGPDFFYYDNNTVYVVARLVDAANASSPYNSTDLRVTGNFTSIGGSANLLGRGHGNGTYTVNGTVSFSTLAAAGISLTGNNAFYAATIQLNASDLTNATNSLLNLTVVLVNMTTMPGCPPNVNQIPPMIPLLNGTMVNVSACWTNCTVEERATPINNTHYAVCGPNFGGATTSFTNIASTGSFESFPLVIDIPGKAKINFTTGVNMSDADKAGAIMQFAMKNLMSGGRMGVNESEWNGLLGKPNMTGLTAELTIYNFSGRFDLPATSTPSIGYRSVYGTGPFSACPANVCSTFRWDGQNLTFTVTGFSEYSVERGLSVVLNTPANLSATNSRTVNLTFTPTWNATTTVRNATLFTNSTGSWVANTTNSTPLVNATVNGIQVTFAKDSAYLWNVVLYDTGTGSDTNTLNWTVTVDTPTMNTTTPATGGYIKGTSTQLFEVYTYDDGRLWNRTNVTLWHKRSAATVWNYRDLTCYNNSVQAVNSSKVCNATVNADNFFWGDGDVINYYFEARNYTTISGSLGTNGTAASPLTITVDKKAPEWSANLTKVANGTQYAPGRNYGFQITWTDTNGVGGVLFESNFTGASASNTTATPAGSGIYYVNFTQEQTLGAGTYRFRWHANDTVLPVSDGNWNFTDWVQYVIVRNATNPIELYINGTIYANGTVITYPAQINAVTNLTYGGRAGSINLFRDGTNVNSTDNGQNIRLPNATYIYKGITAGTINYTSNETLNYTVNVYKGSTRVILYLNRTETNVTIATGEFVNVTATADNSEGWILLYRDRGLMNYSWAGSSNITNVSSYTGRTGTTFNITAYYNGSQNYSTSSNISADSGPTLFIIIETTLPQSSNVQSVRATNATNLNVTNNSIMGKFAGVFNLSAQWNDTWQLDQYWLSTNINGTWINSSFAAFTAGNWSNVTINPSTANISSGNRIFQALVYANDTSANENSTTLFQWTVDGVTPILNTTTPTNNSYITGSTAQLFQIYVYDDTTNVSNVTVWHRRSGVGSWKNSTLSCFNTVPALANNGSLICNKTLNIPNEGYANGDTITFYFEATDYSNILGARGSASNPLNTTVDNRAPQYSNNATNATVIGKPDGISIYALWTDADGLSAAVLQTNETGCGSTPCYNRTTTTTLTNGWSNFTWSNSSLAAGAVVSWRIIANDSQQNVNVTVNSTFSIDNTLPRPSSESTNTTNNTVVAKGAFINVSAQWNDNIRLDSWIIETNITGTASNTSGTAFTTGNWSNYTLDTSNYAVGNLTRIKIYANDTSGNSNTSNSIWFFTIDNTLPRPSSESTNVTNNTQIAKGQVVEVRVQWNDNIQLDRYLLETNSSGTMTNGSASSFTTGNWSNLTTSSTQAPGKMFIARIYANDTSGNSNVSSSTWAWTIDNTAPQVGNVSIGTLNNLTNVTYAPGRSYIFNVTWSDNLGISTVTFEWNGITNYTATNTVSTNYSYTLTDLGVSNYTYKWYANDTSNNQNVTDTQAYNITINTTNPVRMSINFNNGTTVTDTNVSIVYGIRTNVTTSALISNSGTLALFKNSTSTSNFIAVAGVNNDNQTLAIGLHEYKVNITGNTNYSTNGTGAVYSITITSDTVGPSIQIWDPSLAKYTFSNNASARKPTASITLNVSVSDTGIGMTTGEMCFVQIGSGTAQNFATFSSGWCNGTTTVPSITDGVALINITTNDTNDNVGINASFAITVDNTAPTITITVPTNGIYNKSDSVTNSSGIGIIQISGTISDNLQTGTGNLSTNNTNFTIIMFNGNNNTVFAINNTINLSSGYYAIRINYTDNATNVQNATINFYVDNNAPTVITGWTNATYAASSSQTVQVRVTDNLQTNGSITLYYKLAQSAWSSTTMTGTLGTATTYSATIDTSEMVPGQIVKYYVTGIDNATNNLATVNGSQSSPLSAFAIGTTGVLQGYVYLTNTSATVPNSTSVISVSIPGRSAATINASGFYNITDAPTGTYTVTVTGTGYWSNRTSATVTAGATTNANILVTGAENFNVTIPGSATASTGVNGFMDAGWNTAYLRTGIFAAGTTNYTVESLFVSIGSGSSYNYSSVWRFNDTTGAWSSFIPGTTGNTLVNVSSSRDLYYISMNTTDRVEIERKY